MRSPEPQGFFCLLCEVMTKSEFNIQVSRYRSNPEALKRFLMRSTKKPSIKVRLSGEVSKYTLTLMTLQVKKELSKKYGW